MRIQRLTTREVNMHALGSLRIGFRSAIENIERDYGLKYSKEIR